MRVIGSSKLFWNQHDTTSAICHCQEKDPLSLCLPQSLSVHKDAEQKGKAKDEKRDLMLSYRMELNYITHVRVSRLMRF
ncbi:hypothetical protein RND81_12G018600 [Saponaria officinalis]